MGDQAAMVVGLSLCDGKVAFNELRVEKKQGEFWGNLPSSRFAIAAEYPKHRFFLHSRQVKHLIICVPQLIPS
jgi:hypothetical protein